MRYGGFLFFSRPTGLLQRCYNVMWPTRSHCASRTAPDSVSRGGTSWRVMGESVVHCYIDRWRSRGPIKCTNTRAGMCWQFAHQEKGTTLPIKTWKRPQCSPLWGKHDLGHPSSKLQLAHELWRCKPLTPTTWKGLAPRPGLSEMSTEQGPQGGIKELSAKHASGEALSMQASREFSRTPRCLPPCSDMSVLQQTRMSHFWDTHHSRVQSSYVQIYGDPWEEKAGYCVMCFCKLGVEGNVPHPRALWVEFGKAAVSLWRAGELGTRRAKEWLKLLNEHERTIWSKQKMRSTFSFRERLHHLWLAWRSIVSQKPYLCTIGVWATSAWCGLNWMKIKWTWVHSAPCWLDVMRRLNPDDPWADGIPH